MESGETGWAAMGWAGELPDLGHQTVTELMGTPMPMQEPALHHGDVSYVHWLRVENGKSPWSGFSTQLSNRVLSHGEVGNTAPKTR